MEKKDETVYLIIRECSQLSKKKEMEDEAQLGGKVNPLEIVQEIAI